MKFSRRLKPEVDVNLTPLIDVVFLLLIFFMVSTTFTKDTELSIDLPEASAVESRLVNKQVEITVARNGDYAINGMALVNNRIETLRTALESVSAGDTTLPLVITADSKTSHQAEIGRASCRERV